MIFKEPDSNVLLRQMHGVLSSSEPWNSIQIEEEDGEFLETLVGSF